MHDFAGDIFPRYFNLWTDVLNSGFNYWSMNIGAGQDRLSNLVYNDNLLPILMSFIPNWLAFQIYIVTTTGLGIYGFYKYLRVSTNSGYLISVLSAVVLPVHVSIINSTGLASGIQYLPFTILLLYTIQNQDIKPIFKLVEITIVLYINSIMMSFALGYIYVVPFLFFWYLILEKFNLRFICLLLIGITFVTLLHHQNILSLIENSSASHRALRTSISREGTVYFMWQLPILIFVIISLIFAYRSRLLIKRKTIILVIIFVSITIGDIIYAPIWEYFAIGTPLFSLSIGRISFFSPLILGFLLPTVIPVGVKAKKLFLFSISIFLVGLMAYEKYDNLNQWIRRGNYVSAYESEQLKKLKKSDDSIYRVAVVHGVIHPNMLNAYGFETAGGYSPMYPMSYNKFWDSVISPLKKTDHEMYKYFADWGSRYYLFTGLKPSGKKYHKVNPDKFFKLDLLSLINVKYLVSHQPLVDNRLKLLSSGTNAMALYGFDKLVLRLKENFYGRSSLFIYENLEYLDRFFVVDKVAFYKNDLEYKEFMQDSNTSTLKKTVLFRDSFRPIFEKINMNVRDHDLKIIQYAADKIALDVDVDSASILVVSNNYNNRWECFNNGEKTDILKAYGTFWGLLLKKNENQIECFYRSRNLLSSIAQ